MAKAKKTNDSVKKVIGAKNEKSDEVTIVGIMKYMIKQLRSIFVKMFQCINRSLIVNNNIPDIAASSPYIHQKRTISVIDFHNPL